MKKHSACRKEKSGVADSGDFGPGTGVIETTPGLSGLLLDAGGASAFCSA